MTDLEFQTITGGGEQEEAEFVDLKELEVGSTIGEGPLTYEGIVGKTKQYNTNVAKFRKSDGTPILLYAVGNLKGLINNGKIPEGSTVKIDYQGKEAIKEGEWKGSLAHTFTVAVAKSAVASGENAEATGSII